MFWCIFKADEISGKLGLQDVRGHDWSIQPTCAVNGEGLYEGIDWLAASVKKK